MKKTGVLLILLCLFCTIRANDLKFRHLEVKDGLSNNQINHIFKDSEGYMWISTASGLNRYDGNQVTVFRSYTYEKGPLPDNYIYDVQEAGDKLLWIRTGADYCVYDPVTESFDRDILSRMLRFGIEGKPELVRIDKTNNFWFYLDSKGVFRVNAHDSALTTQNYYYHKLPEGQIVNMTECDEGMLLLYNTGNIVCLNHDNTRIEWQLTDISEQLGDHIHEYFNAFVDKDKDIWIYGPLGLWIYDPHRKEWKKELADKILKQPSNNMVRSIAQDTHGKLWIGRDLDGITIFDKRTGNIRSLRNRPGDERSLQFNSINALYADKDRCMWVGTFKKGVSYYNESTFKFDINHLGDINAIVEDPKGDIWLGTNDAGLIRWNPKNGKTEAYTVANTGNRLSANVIVSMIAATDGKLWIGTFWGGLDCLDRGKTIHYKNDPDNKNSLANNNVWSLVEDKKGRIWIATLGGGLQCLDPSTGRFDTYTQASHGLSSDHISSLHLTKNGNLLIGTSRGVTVLDLETGYIRALSGSKSGENSFSNQNINHIYEDSRGLWWIATRDLLNIYNPKTDSLRIITVEEGLSNPFIAGVIEDNNKNMWITTARGVTNIVVGTGGKVNEYTFQCYSYDDKDGLQNGEFNQRSVCKLASGEILMGGLYGINGVSPNEIKYNKVLPNVIFTHLSLFNEDVMIGEKYGNRVILDQSLNHIGQIELNYSQNIFSIQFTSDNYVLPEKMKYSYKLEGFNNEWLTTTTGKITYTNLAPGKYKLKVKAINNDGYSSEREASLSIVIRPPFWWSGWAFFIYGVLFILILALGRYMILRHERNKYKIRQIEQEALKNQEINDMKLRFFTNISHELRTPLTLILSPLDSLIKEHETEDVLADKLKMIRRNSMRLLNLVNQLLDFRKGDVNGHQLCLSEGDIIEFVNAVCNSFRDLSEIKHVHLTFFSSIRSLTMSFDGDKLGKVVMNLLSNAFKFTSEGGRVDVSVDLVPQGDGHDMLEIKVSDTGIGIPDEEKERIFERFYQAEHPNMIGSGIGLSIVRDFMSLHNGTVRVYDNVPSGSVFILHLPVKRAYERTADDIAELPEMNERALFEAHDPSDPSSESDIALHSSHEEAHHDHPAVREESAPGRRRKKEPSASGSLVDLMEKKERNETEKEDDKRPTILVVDDNDDFLTFMYDSLSVFYRVKIATNGREAWEMIPDIEPELIISDVMMPEMDGNELCRLIKANKQTTHIPVVLLTARQSSEYKLESLTIGADDYITKPFNMDILLLRIKKHIELRSSRNSGRINPEPSEIRITSLDEKLIDNAIRYVENNISRSDFSVEELSRELGMSRVHLYKKLLAITNKTPIEFIRIIRLKRAAQLLRESQQNVSEIAYQVGFNNPKYFSKYFKEEFGVLPSTYQEKEGK